MLPGNSQFPNPNPSAPLNARPNVGTINPVKPPMPKNNGTPPKTTAPMPKNSAPSRSVGATMPMKESTSKNYGRGY